MKIALLQISISLALTLLVSVCWAAKEQEKWVIATLEWPPFICTECPDEGAGAKALRAALKPLGIDVEFIFFSWTQALREGANKKIVGYFPAWEREVLPGFLMSDPIFSSPIGFIEPKKKPLIWSDLKDLKGKKIGGAKDYKYPSEFMNLVDEGLIKLEIVVSDDTNVRKVSAGRLDGAIIDTNNAEYFLKFSNKNLSKTVQVNNKIIESKPLHLVFNEHHREKKKILAKALAATDTQKIVDDYLRKLFKKGSSK